MSQYLTLQANIPEEIALQFSEGLEVEGKYGPQVMFTLDDGRKLYLNPGVADEIARQGIGRGERFTICKRSDGKRTSHQIKRVDPATPVNPSPAPQATVSTSTTAVLEPSNRTTSAQGREALLTQLGNVLLHGDPEGLHVAPNGNGHGNQAPAAPPPAPPSRPNPAPPAPSLMTGAGQAMLEQFISVYEVMVAVEKYSVLKGRAVVFTSEDFRAASIACYIGSRNGGGR